MNDKIRQEYFEDVIKNEFPSILQLVKRNMDFELFGFRQTFLGVFNNFPPGAILDSELCRVRLLWHPSDPRDGDYKKKITFLYGRLHAPDDENVIMWEGEKCYCWHNIDLAVNFLDGISPEKISVSGSPQIMNKYYQPNIRKMLNLNHVSDIDIQPELMTRMHNEVWEVYGQRLFSLFDIHNVELWEKYKLYVKKYYNRYQELIMFANIC